MCFVTAVLGSVGFVGVGGAAQGLSHSCSSQRVWQLTQHIHIVLPGCMAALRWRLLIGAQGWPLWVMDEADTWEPFVG